MNFYFSDFINLFFDVFYWLLSTDLFLCFIYVFIATGIIVLAQKFIRMVLNL